MTDHGPNRKQPVSTHVLGTSGEKENISPREILQHTEENQIIQPCTDICAKQNSVQQRLDSSTGSNRSIECAELKESRVLEEKLSPEELEDELFDTDAEASIGDDDLSQGAPLSMKNLFKVVRTFSKRLPKSSKPRPVPKKAVKDAEIVVFKRPPVVREASTTAGSRAVSGFLPPILDFQEIVGSDARVDNEHQHRPRRAHSKVSRLAPTIAIPQSLGPMAAIENRRPPPTEDEQVLHPCAENVENLAPDALHEFGSSDSAMVWKGGERGKSRKSFGFLYNQLDEHETLQF